MTAKCHLCLTGGPEVSVERKLGPHTILLCPGCAANPPRPEVEFNCPACDGGTVRPLAVAGRIWSRKGGPWEIPAHIAIPTCDNCAQEWVDARTAFALDEAYYGEVQRESA